MTSKQLNKIHEVKTINKDRSNRSESTRRHGYNPEFLLFRGVRLVGEVWATTKVKTQPPQTSPSSPMNRTTKVWFTFHYRNPSRRNPEPLQHTWGSTHKRIGGSQAPQHLPHKSSKQISTTRCLCFLVETLGSNTSSEWGGNEERFGEVVDPGLLLQSSKDQRVWMEGLGDLVILELAIMLDFNLGLAHRPKVGGGE